MKKRKQSPEPEPKAPEAAPVEENKEAQPVTIPDLDELEAMTDYREVENIMGKVPYTVITTFPPDKQERWLKIYNDALVRNRYQDVPDCCKFDKYLSKAERRAILWGFLNTITGWSPIVGFWAIGSLPGLQMMGDHPFIALLVAFGFPLLLNIIFLRVCFRHISGDETFDYYHWDSIAERYTFGSLGLIHRIGTICFPLVAGLIVLTRGIVILIVRIFQYPFVKGEPWKFFRCRNPSLIIRNDWLDSCDDIGDTPLTISDPQTYVPFRPMRDKHHAGYGQWWPWEFGR